MLLRRQKKSNNVGNKECSNRCYAKWSGNGMFYWGYIKAVTGRGKNKKYSVSRRLCSFAAMLALSTKNPWFHNQQVDFDDGDHSAGILSNDVYTVAQYNRITGTDPVITAKDYTSGNNNLDIGYQEIAKELNYPRIRGKKQSILKSCKSNISPQEKKQANNTSDHVNEGFLKEVEAKYEAWNERPSLFWKQL